MDLSLPAFNNFDSSIYYGLDEVQKCVLRTQILDLVDMSERQFLLMMREELATLNGECIRTELLNVRRMFKLISVMVEFLRHNVTF